MREEFNFQNKDEHTKAENDFLKMKLMLEHGAQFDEDNSQDISPELENVFLNNVQDFEKQFQERKRIILFDKIGRPQHFKPVSEIPADDIDEAWSELNSYLNKYNIDLGVCSPNISKRELYRFTTEELFDHEMNDMNLPGWTTNFIYDEFHPDPIYDNTRVATEDCISYFLDKREVTYLTFFKKDGLRLNNFYPLSEDELKALVNQFKDTCDEIDLTECEMKPQCTLNGDSSTVTGDFTLGTIQQGKKSVVSGTWTVDFVRDSFTGYWEIINIQIPGVDF